MVRQQKSGCQASCWRRADLRSVLFQPAWIKKKRVARASRLRRVIQGTEVRGRYSFLNRGIT
jgi:hypothetical protein